MRRRPSRLTYPAIVVFVLVSFQGVDAQLGGGSITGLTLDPTGAIVAGAKVRATNVGTNTTLETVTNQEGHYEFPLLPAGRYVLQAEHTGFQIGRSAEFTLNSGTRPRFDLMLALGAVSEQVQVVSAAPQVNTTTTDLGVVMTRDRVESLPLNGRNYQTLVGLQSGALAFPSTYTGQRGGMELNGAPAFGINLLLDGVDMSFGENSAPASDRGAVSNGGSKINTVSVEAIQEFKTSSSVLSAEYGRATSGVVNVTTKSGTNQLHGTLFEFFRNDKMDANSFFSNLSSLPKPALRWNQYGGNLGGPVLKDKLFFFTNYEGATVRQADQVTGNVPTPLLTRQLTPAIQKHFAGLPITFTPTSNPLIGLHRRNDKDIDDEHTTLSRMDYITGPHQVAVRYSYNHQDFSRPEGVRPANQRVFPTRFHNAVIQDGMTISPAMFNEVRLGFNRTDVNRRNTTFDTEPAYLTVLDVGLTSDFESRLAFLTTTYTLADNFTYVRGRSTWKAGFEIRDVRSSRVQATNPQHTYNTLADLIADNASRITINFGIPDRGLSTTNTGFFVQDEWRVSRRVQLNLGLRYEYYTPLTGAFNVTSSDPFGPMGTKGSPMFHPDRNDFAPRLGIVFDPLGNQKLVVRAGGAIMYAPPQPSVYYNMSFIDPRIPFSAVFTRADLPADVSMAYPFPQSFANRIIADPGGLPKNVLLGRQVADFNRADEYSGQWNFTLQYAVRPTLAVQASYVGTRALKLYAMEPANDPNPKTGVRPVSSVGEVLFTENAARSSYHGLQLAANQRLSHGLSFDAYYTFAKTLVYYGVDQGYTAPTATVQDFSNIAASNGPKETDLRHTSVGVVSYSLPSTAAISRSKFASFFLGGWNVQGIESWRSGFPVNVIAGRDLVGNTRPGGQRPDLVPNQSPYIKTGDRLLWLNRAAFDIITPQNQKRFGSLGMNTFRGPSGFSLDGSIHKVFVLHEKQRITFRGELFNALNHKILSNPNATVSSPTFGSILSATGGRNIQLALKYNF